MRRTTNTGAAPGPKAREIIALDTALLSTSLSRTSDLVAVRARGVFVEDADGNVFLDFGSGIAVSTTGHNHPRVVTTDAQVDAGLDIMEETPKSLTRQDRYATLDSR